ncbi:MAG TPA: ABC transporter ATP-binding protein [Solirubrobacteraceae bacterium]
MLKVDHLIKSFPSRHRDEDRVRAVNDVSLDVEDGQFFTMLGPSGCGKTTTLRCVAGLETPDAGEIAVGERVLFSSSQKIKAPANERGLGMVFQSYAIWPHMNVYKNVAFPLEVLPRGKRLAKRDLRERVERVLAVVKLDHLANRQATDLSGGQQQRLALARALVMEPPLLLLDEPLSNLDAKLREDMRFELKRLQRELGITAVYVTHDQSEALAMSNMVAVMKEGEVQQLGRPREIYEHPRTRFVADFIGTSNFIDGVIERSEGERYLVETAYGKLAATSGADFAPGTKVVVAARPEQIEIEPGQANGSVPNEWYGTVGTRAFVGESVDHVVTVGDSEIRVRSNPSVSISQGTGVVLTFREDACSLIPAGE